MKLSHSLFVIVGILHLATAAQAVDPYFPNRAEVIRSADSLASEVEHLDEALHAINAPTALIQKVHHFEETVFEFADEVRAGCTYAFANEEMNHIRQDVQSIRLDFDRYPYLLNNIKVANEWRMMRRAYRWLDHAMFMHSRNMTDEMDSALQRDIQILEQHLAEKN